MEYSGLGKLIRRLRRERAWSQAQLAEIAGLSERTVQRVEKLGQCSYETLMAMASAFEVDVREFTKHPAADEEAAPADVLTETNVDEVPTEPKHRRWSPGRIALISGIVMFPAFYLVLANVLAHSFDIWFLAAPLQAFYSNPEISDIFSELLPVVFIGGLGGAVILNLLAMISIRFMRSQNGWMSLVRFVPRRANLSVLGLSAVVSITLITYRILENSTYY